MSVLAAMNQVLTPDAVMWAAAAASLVLLVSVGAVRFVLAGGRRDAGFRALRIALVLVLMLTAGLPLALFFAGEAVSGLPCGCFLAFFPLFCYYFGKGLGYEKGRGGLADLVGLENAGDVEDAQDRLYESRLRFPSREAVLTSIARLTRAEAPSGAEATAREPDESGSAGSGEILDVLVEEV